MKVAKDTSPDDAQSLTRQQERSGLSTRRLLQASAELIVEKGYERTTLADIGKRAGYSHGLVTQRFGNKASMLTALWERMRTGFGPERIFELVGDRIGIEAVQHVVREIAADAKRSPESLAAFYALLFEAIKPIPELQDHVRKALREYRDNIETLIKLGHDAGTVRKDVDPQAMADFVVDAIRGASYHWMLDPDEVDFVVRLNRLADHIRQIYAAPA